MRGRTHSRTAVWEADVNRELIGKHASVREEFGMYNRGLALNLATKHPAARPFPPSSPCPQRTALFIVPSDERFDGCLLYFRAGHDPGGWDLVGYDLQ